MGSLGLVLVMDVLIICILEILKIIDGVSLEIKNRIVFERKIEVLLRGLKVRVFCINLKREIRISG